MSNPEAIVLGDKDHNFSYIFIGKDGLNIQEPPKYEKGKENKVSFLNNNVKLYKILNNAVKNRPEDSLSSGKHSDTHLYYYKQKEHKLIVFEFFNGANRIKYDVSDKQSKFFFVKNIVFYANDKPTSEEIDDEFIRIMNEAIAIANEKVKPSSLINSVMF